MVTQLLTPRLCIYIQGWTYYRLLTGSSFWTIGRSKSNDIVLPDRTISRKHAMLQITDTNDVYCIDLGSRNGLFVNGERITLPVCLHDGDRLLIGKTELEFQVPLSEETESQPYLELAQPNASTQILEPKLAVEPEQCHTTTVLMFQPDKHQGLIWQRLLSSLGITVIWETEDTDTPHVIERLRNCQILPDLLLIDIGVLQPNPFVFCRWCREEQPQLKLVLTNHFRTEIYASERRWAAQQGALDLLAGFPDQNLMANSIEIIRKLNCVLEVLSWKPIQKRSLFSVLQHLQLEFEAD